MSKAPLKKELDKTKKKIDDAEDEVSPPQPSEKEILLQQELDTLTAELDELKNNVESLRKENEFLQQEANRVRTENHEYMSYMEKKTSKRQSAIVSLSDYNQREIESLKEERRVMLDAYAKKKEEFQARLMEKEHMLSRIKQQLEEVQEFKNLQEEQQNRIKELEREVMTTRGKHSSAIQEMKRAFLKEKQDFIQTSEAKKVAMVKQANMEAMQCLNEQTTKIKQDNRQLRHELLLLIRKGRALQQQRNKLEEERQRLLLEQKYCKDLKTIRTARQQHLAPPTSPRSNTNDDR